MTDIVDRLSDEAHELWRHLPAGELTDDEQLFFRTTRYGHLVVGRRVGDAQDEYQLVGFDQPEGVAAMHTRRWVEPEDRAPHVVARMFRDGVMSHEAVVPYTSPSRN